MIHFFKEKQIRHYMYFTLGSHHRSANVLNMCWQDLLLVYISSFHFYCHKSCKFNIFPSHYNTVIFLLSSFPKKKYVFMMDIFKRSNCIPFSRTNRNGVSGHEKFSLKNTWSCSLQSHLRLCLHNEYLLYWCFIQKLIQHEYNIMKNTGVK